MLVIIDFKQNIPDDRFEVFFRHNIFIPLYLLNKYTVIIIE